jgi:hypothetical protein
MSTIIGDGTGTGNAAKVGGKRLFTHAITETEPVHATTEGDAYNINTGDIALTSSTASSILYLKNNEDRDMVIEAIAVGVGSAGTTTDVTKVTVIRNPTSVSYSTAVDMNQNRNFGSSKTLTADAYKGAEGATTTGGNNIIQFYMGAGTRLFAPINILLTKGSSMAIEADTNTSSGTTNVYAAIVCYLKDADLEED